GIAQLPALADETGGQGAHGGMTAGVPRVQRVAGLHGLANKGLDVEMAAAGVLGAVVVVGKNQFHECRPAVISGGNRIRGAGLVRTQNRQTSGTVVFEAPLVAVAPLLAQGGDLRPEGVVEQPDKILGEPGTEVVKGAAAPVLPV